MSRAIADVEDPFGCSGFARSPTANDGFPFWVSAASSSSGSSTSRDSDSSETGCSPYVSIMRMTEAAIAEHDQTVVLPDGKSLSSSNSMNRTSDTSCILLDPGHEGAENVQHTPSDFASSSRSSSTSCCATSLTRRSLKERILKPFPSMKLIRQPSRASREFDLFVSRIQWLCLDQSGTWSSICSWTAFVIFGVLIPAISFTSVRCTDACPDHDHSFTRLVTSIDTILCFASFTFLTRMQQQPGLRQVLQLDFVFTADAANVLRKYTIELHKLVRSLMLLILPALLIKTLKNVIWFASAEAASPCGSHSVVAITNAGMATTWIVVLEFSWAYQALVYLFVCVLFRFMCSMQAIRIQAYIERLEDEVDVAAMLSHHMQLRDHMATISHQFRNFLLKALLVVCASQFSALFSFLRLHGSTPIPQATDLMVCTYVQLAGVLLCLHGAARITHQGQKIVTVVSQWHAAATCRNFAGSRKEISHVSGSNEPTVPFGGSDLFSSIAPVTTPPRAAAQHLALPLLSGVHRAMHAGNFAQPSSPLAPKALSMQPGRSGYPRTQAALASMAVDGGCLPSGNKEPRVPAENTFVGSDGEGLALKTPLGGERDGMTSSQHAEAEGEGKKSCVPGQGLIKMLHRVGSGVATLVDIAEIGKEPKNYESDAFHKRVAFVTYLQHCPCGITLYGFSMDRSFLYAIFGLVFSLATFIISQAASANLPKETFATLSIGV